LASDVFISYRRQDSGQLAHLVKDELEKEGIDFFLDVEGLDTTGPFPARLMRAIGESKVFVSLLGEHTLESEWVRKEIEHAYTLGLTLIPVFQPGFVRPADPQPESVGFLLQNQGVKIPDDNTFLPAALEKLVEYVKDALRPPEINRRSVLLRGIAIGLVIGIALGLIAGLLGPGVLDRNESPGRAEWKTNVVDGDRVAQSLTLIAEYPGKLEGDLWVFVVSPNGRVYPQSEDPCRGTSAFQAEGKWEIRVALGTAESVGESFDIVLAVAKTPADNLYITYKLMAWCIAGDYPGFETLPEEVTEVHRVSGLVRTDETWEQPPNISNTRLDGQVAITSIASGASVPEVTSIEGTYLHATGDVWVLVSPIYARWYPQSETPCAAAHARQENGQWQAPKVSFGGKAGEAFDVVVILATPEASAFFDSKLKLWCKAGYYSGLRTIELPQGIDEKARLRVFRE
jgi:hypothetical protein